MFRKLQITLIVALLLNLLSGLTAMGQATQTQEIAAEPAAAPVPGASAAVNLADAAAHWAAKPIARWVQAGIVSGYDDGLFHPDAAVTRAQFAVMVNGLFGFTQADASAPADVPAGAWYAAAMLQAKKAGYMQGYPDNTMHPNDPVSRQDAAVMLSRLLRLGGSGVADIVFTDAAAIADYAQDAIQAMAGKGYLSGYSDGSMQPRKALTRAEIATLLDNMIGRYVSERGSFASAGGQGSVILNAPGLSLSDQVVAGNLFVTGRVGEGDATLDNVIVKGTTIVAGGGKNSIHVNNSILGKTIIDKSDGAVRVVASGSGSIGETHVQSSAVLVEQGVDGGSGFTDVIVDSTEAGGASVELAGSFGKVRVEGSGHTLNLSAGSAEQLALNAKTDVTIGGAATVKQLQIGAGGSGSKLSITGNLGSADIQADAVTLNNQTVRKGQAVNVKDGAVGAGSDAGVAGGFFGGGGGGGGAGASNPRNVDVIGDGDFSAGLGGWKASWGNDETGLSTGTLSTEQGQMKVSLQAVGSSAQSALVYRDGLTLSSGTVYTVSFKARATASRKINVAVSDGVKDVATLRSFVLTSDLQTYSYSFTMQEISSATGKLTFQLGTISGGTNAPVDVFFDDVQLTAVQGAIVDKTALNAKLAQADGLLESEYTAVSWSILQNALITAREAGFSNTATKQQVDQAVLALTRAIDGLVKVQRSAGLTDIVFTDGGGSALPYELTPGFRADRYSYVLGVRSGTATVLLDPKLAPNNTVTAVTGASASGGKYAAAVQAGTNEVTFEVAQPGKVAATYHVYLIKEQSGNVRRDPADWQLDWNDEFNGDQVDTSKWNFVNQGGGFGNRELEYYTPRTENARIEPLDDGNKGLVIEARKEKYNGQDYTSAKLFSQNKGDWTYGKFEIRAKLPKSQGIWPAIWMMPTNYDLYGPWPATGEIDIMELVGHEPATVWGTLHYGMPWKYSNSSFKLPGTMDFSQDFHTFSIEWEPGEIRWYVDGIFYQRQNDWYTKRDGESAPYTWPAPFDRDFYIQLNLAVGGDWPQFPDNTTIFPSRMTVDYVRVYKLKDGLSYADPGNGPASTINVPTPRPENGLGGLVYNGTFDEGIGRMQFWSFSADNTAQASYSVGTAIPSREFKASLTNGGSSPTAVQLTQTGIPLVKNRQYQLKFKARASENGTALQANVFKGATSYSGVQTFPLSADMQTYSYIFIMTGDNENNAQLAFNLGQNTGDIYLDDVKLTTYYPPQYQKLEAEDFANQTGYAVQDGAIAPTAGDSSWVQYNATIPAEGDYMIAYRVATAGDNAKLTFQGAGPGTRTIHLPNTGGLTQWQTVTDLVHLKAGTQTLLLAGTGYRLDSFTLGQNVVKNGSLDSGTDQWDLWTQNAGGTVLSTVQGQTKLAITAEGDDFWGTQFSQLNVPLYKGKTYRVSFEARSTVNRKLRLTIDDPVTNGPYALYDAISLTPQLKTYTFDFTMTGATNLASRIDFNLGKIGTASGVHDVVLDQVRFAEIPAIEQASGVAPALVIDAPGDMIQVQQADGFTALTVNQGALNPAFQSGTTDYTVKVASNVTSITLTPTLAADNTLSLVSGAVQSGGDYTATLSEGENAISFIIDQAGRVPKAYMIHVIRTPLNLAKGKTATASSGAGNLAVDGDMATRWESDHSDPQTLNVDLGDLYNLSSVTLNWETSRATAYTLEVSTDKSSWITVYSTTNGSGPTDTITIPEMVTARYIRLTGTERFSFGGVRYGYSLFELAASGAPYATAADFHAFKGALAATITGAGALIEADYTSDSWAALTTALSAANAAYNQADAAQAAVNSAAQALTNAMAALVKLTKADGLTALTLSQGTLSPQFAKDTLSYSVIVNNAAATLDFTPVLESGNVFDAVYGATETSPGVYQANLDTAHHTVQFVVAKAGAQLTKTYTINIVRLSATNAALGKSATSSSGTASAATDGNAGTRWESLQSDPQWIYVDLGSSQTITAVKLTWETASAKTYKIQVTDTPNDESSWHDIGSFDQEGLAQAPRTDLITATGTGQYVRMYGTKRNTPWGYSIFEFEVYTDF
ncbi:carbohydrate binding domain-containing protein [Paenibacillus athensensis]|nr:discoidin domain-containing protein [Paenibacillus athensensis]MCD1259259.1 carbohydrate binding domain-containing protein [Paenibacillus athensensis]